MPTLEDLLNALSAQQLPPLPAPAQPLPLGPITPPNVPQYGGLSQVVEPPQAPLDNRIIQQYQGLAGQAPTPPAPLSRGQRIANALIGFGAGVQGNGPQFLQQLQEPQREYQRQLERYNNTRSDLALRGSEAALRDQERRTARAQELSDREFQQEFARESRRLNLYDDQSKARLQQAFQLERDARQARLQEAHQLAIEQRQREDDARGIAGRLGTGPGAAPPHIAKELGRYYANVTQELSPAAAKWVNAQARRAEILARPAVGGGSAAASRREMQDLQRRTSQAAQGIAGMEKLARQAMENPEAKRAPILNQMRSMAATLQAQFPELVEVGEHNGWPFARLRLRGAKPGQQPQQPQAPVDPLGLGVR
jgi:hypothetical protein